MPNLEWSKLSALQLGKYAEYYAKMEFTSYGYDVYTSEVDDHGVDFVVKDPKGNFLEVQVKSSMKSNYVFIPKNKIVVDERHLVCFIRFKDGELPKVYVIPAVAWLKPSHILVNRDYDKPGQRSKPEWGINWSKKNEHLFEEFKIENYFKEQK